MKMTLKRAFTMLLALALAVSCLGMTALAEEPAHEVETNMMHRMYNPNTREHFYTGSEEERDDLIAVGWEYEGVAWAAPTNEGEPVYRMFNPNAGDHHYTMSEKERDDLKEAGWKYEGVAWNSYSKDVTNYGVAHYRLYNPNMEAGNHHYTASVNELNDLINAGWKYEGIAYYGYALAANYGFHREYGHSFAFEADWVDAPDGCRYYVCDCGVRIAMHDSRWLMTKAPTETTAGEKVRECNICGKKETGEIPAGKYEALSAEPIYFHDYNPIFLRLYRVNPDGSDFQHLMNLRSSTRYAQDNGLILHLDDNEEDMFSDLFVYDVATNKDVQLTHGRELPYQSSIALADGNAYYSMDSLAVIHHNLETGETHEITIDNRYFVEVKIVNGIVYLLTRTEAEDANTALYTYNPETRTCTKVYQADFATVSEYLAPADNGVVVNHIYMDKEMGWNANTATFVPEDNTEAQKLHLGEMSLLALNKKYSASVLYHSEKGTLYSVEMDLVLPYELSQILVYSSAEGEDSILFSDSFDCQQDGDRVFIVCNGEYYIFDNSFFEQTGCLIPLNNLGVLK